MKIELGEYLLVYYDFFIYEVIFRNEDVKRGMVMFILEVNCLIKFFFLDVGVVIINFKV